MLFKAPPILAILSFFNRFLMSAILSVPSRDRCASRRLAKRSLALSTALAALSAALSLAVFLFLERPFVFDSSLSSCLTLTFLSVEAVVVASVVTVSFVFLALLDVLCFPVVDDLISSSSSWPPYCDDDCCETIFWTGVSILC